MAADPSNVPGEILIGGVDQEKGVYSYLNLPFANRHGLITGATGTGKTVSLQKLIEGFSNAGVPVFAADVKGDLAGVSAPGDGKPAVVKRCEELGLQYTPEKLPVVFWDVYGEEGHPIRATVTEMGPLLLARMLELNDTQEGVLNIVFRIADEQKLALLDLKDLRAVLGYVADNASDLTTKYGNVAAASVGAIQRRLLTLEQQGADRFFGEPALEVNDFIQKDRIGCGIVNILAAQKLMQAPRLYATFLLWLLSELYETLPEIGDPPQPKLVFFFDEAHLLFDNAPKALMTAVEQVVRLVRSKGVGVYFVSQNPLDVPDVILGQLGNRIQHALRAYTPRDQKAVRAAAETFRQNPKIDSADAITQLNIGEALVSMLDERGAPRIVQRVWIAPPLSRIGPITPDERRQIIAANPLAGKYDTPVDRESAFEILQNRVKQRTGGGADGAADTPPSQGGWLNTLGGMVVDALGSGGRNGGRKHMSAVEVAIRSGVQTAARRAGTEVVNAIVRGVLGGLSR